MLLADAFGPIGAIGDIAMWNLARSDQKSALQNSISWRVADAKRAGIHPLAALGVTPMNMPPSSVGDTLSRMGQGISTHGKQKQLLQEQINETRARANYFNSQARSIDANSNNTIPDPGGVNNPSLPPGQNSSRIINELPRVKTSEMVGKESGVHPLQQSHIDSRYRLWDLESQQAQESISEGSLFTQIRYNLVQLADYVRGYGAWAHPKIAPETLSLIRKNRRKAPDGYEYRYNVLFGGYILRKKTDNKSFLFDHPSLNDTVSRSIRKLQQKPWNSRSPVPKNEYKLWDY